MIYLQALQVILLREVCDGGLPLGVRPSEINSVRAILTALAQTMGVFNIVGGWCSKISG
jgi:hypothetical protein